MERRRGLRLHLQAHSSQPAFQIKADEVSAPVTVHVRACACVFVCDNVIVKRDIEEQTSSCKTEAVKVAQFVHIHINVGNNLIF